ncbi:hypothetical protein [Streptosporangium lutulentum]|uniref:Uncharacterized protein n=1 Tax=Streptosporangium lutulentum TaxID=1461250 RepID=A0ABT9QMG8_9ACTN|nr:hypothetical protein [Streptosporangium lutulentum]MDP9847119.1 hypothetical protein [Streptosporangium lutulentum]
MIPEFHSQMIAHRLDELLAEADAYRLVREARDAEREERPKAKRRRSLFGKIIPA